MNQQDYRCAVQPVVDDIARLLNEPGDHREEVMKLRRFFVEINQVWIRSPDYMPDAYQTNFDRSC